MARGEFALVKELIEKAIGKEHINADPDLLATLTDVAVQRREMISLRKYATMLEEIAMDLDHKLYVATAHRAWGVMHQMEGEFEEAEARLEQAVDLFRRLDTRWQLGRTYFELGELAVDRAEAAEASQHYARALELFEEMSAIPDAGRVQGKLSKVKNGYDS